MYKTINIDAGLHKKLKLYGAERGLSITELVKDAVSIYLDPYTTEVVESKIKEKIPKGKSIKEFKDRLPTPKILADEFPASQPNYKEEINPSALPSEPQDELSKLKEKYPNIKLFGKTRTCPFCSEQIPIELAQKHYEDKHEGS